MNIVYVFQMVSLLHLADITEEGVNFESPKDGSKLLLTPEESISIQNNLGMHQYYIFSLVVLLGNLQSLYFCSCV